MSNNLDSLSDALNFEIIKEIDNLELPMMQKHHVRILAHCLQILKTINADDNSELCDKKNLREWCDSKTEKFEDKKFSDLFYTQLDSTAKKLNTFSQRIGKKIEDLEINDLVLLVKQSQKSLQIDPEEKIYFVESLTNLGNKI